ncbi:MAG: hypothetical protein NNA22_11495, partial [Nitrospira sp.]|nr:hypothetical protein [Nitrospira sp.]
GTLSHLPAVPPPPGDDKLLGSAIELRPWRIVKNRSTFQTSNLSRRLAASGPHVINEALVGTSNL